MCNHIHLLLEVPPMADGGLSDEELLKRLRAIYSEAFVSEVAKEIAEAREQELDFRVAEIHARYSYRMHSLAEFMKGLLQRYTQWHNREHSRTGTLWEDRFKSVIVEDGVAAKTIAAYIDLNPVRAGMVKDPADYRWSSYGEAIGGGPKGNGKKARAGLVRALRAHLGVAADAGFWANDVSREYSKILMAGAAEKQEARVNRDGSTVSKQTRKGMAAAESAREIARDGEISLGKMLRCRIRYFTDGAVIGSRIFVNDTFDGAKERFGPKRKDGARKLRGSAAAAAGVLWGMRDLRKNVG
jgi:REP element-mobilizing transposase RayT